LQPILYMVQELQQTSSLARVDGASFLCSQYCYPDILLQPELFTIT
jgi:hypothetical protein